MLTKYDEFLCHQTVDPFVQVHTTERNWTEKAYLSAYDTSGKVFVVATCGKYANRNVMDAAGGVALPGRQYTVRASRELWPGVDSEKVGPISYEVVEPLKKIRMCLGENDYGISFDIEFDGCMSPMEEPGGLTRTRRGRVIINNTVRFYQLGRASGKITVEGKTYQLKKESCYAYRDRSWGIRSVTGVPPEGSWYFQEGIGGPESGMMPAFAEVSGSYLGAFISARFKDYCLFYTHAEGRDGKPIPPSIVGQGGFMVYPEGDPRPPKRITGGQFEFQFIPGTRLVKSVQAVMNLEDGTKKEFSTETPLKSIFYPRALGYNGFRGWWQGKWVGPYAIDGEKLDLTDEKTVDELTRGCWADVGSECRCGDDIGYSLLNVCPVGDLPKYGFKL